MKLKDHVEFLKETKKLIEESTDYNLMALIRDGSHNSKDLDSKARVQYVLDAEKMFLSEHKNDILALAAKLIQDELDEVVHK